MMKLLFVIAFVVSLSMVVGQGPEGLKGEVGQPGRRGHNGSDGKMGPEGPPGRDGIPGTPGMNGRPGLMGRPGAVRINEATEILNEIRGIEERLDRMQNQIRNSAKNPCLDFDVRDCECHPGFPGQRGPIGDPGYPGQNGKCGRRGDRGPRGQTGRVAEPALDGIDGEVGPVGADGRIELDPSEKADIRERLRVIHDRVQAMESQISEIFF